MKVKNKKICLSVCSLLAMASIFGGAYSISSVQDVAAEGVVAEYVATDTETQSAWESAGYGTEGYLIMGANASSKAAAYSNMYTEQGNDGKTEITMTRGGNTYWYYDSACTISTDSTAPISGFMLNGSSIWQGGNQSKTSYLYIPGTETTYPGRIHNNMTSVYRDFGLGFNLRETEKTYVSVYVSDWNGKASESLPITVGLYSGIKTATIQGFSSGGVVDRTTSMTDHYGTALAETTLTTGAGAYVTFAIEGAGDYQIVAYYDNQDSSTDASIIPMFSGLFFDKEGFEEEEIVPPTIEVSLDTETKSAWESAGYGTDGYMVFGVNTSNKPAVYSNMYTKQGNDGKTEITLNKKGDNSYYYDADLTKSTDRTAPISSFVVNGSSAWQAPTSTYWTNQPDLYIPGTETTYPVRLHNNIAGLYSDFGIGFTLTTTEKIYVTAYVLDWQKKVSESLPITVGLFSGIKSTTVYGYGNNTATTVDEHYGTALVETTVTTQGAYVTFAIEEAGDYQIVAYYDNQGTSNATVTPMIAGLFFDEPEPALPEITTSVFVDTTSKSAWEANGYGSDGYLVLGGVKAYSNMYTERGNDGKTEISLYKNGDNSIYYNSTLKSTDSTAPISGFVVNGSSVWQAPTGTYWTNQPDLYIPGTETTYPVRLHNNIAGPYKDFGLGFTLRETEKIYVTVYVLDWEKKVSESLPITVGLFSGIKNTTVYGYGNNTATTVDEHYGTALVETMVTTQGAYVTFAIEGAGNYQIVAYYDNQGTSNASIAPMITGLFFDKEIYPEVTSTSLSLEGDIGVNYYVGARGQDLTGGYLQVKYANGNIQQVPVSDRNTDGTYKFQVKIAAKDYTTKMKVRLFDEAGNAISKAFEYSAANYVQSILSAGAAVYGEKLVALAMALDDYGKAAENLFYGENNTFTADLSTVTTSTLTAHKFSVSGSLPAGVKLSDFSLLLKSTTSLKIYFTAESLDGIVCKVGDTEIAPEATGVANEYCIVIENINAKDLDTNYVVSIGGYQLTLSTLSYSLRALEYSSNASLKTAVQALYLYNQAANAYFEEA